MPRGSSLSLDQQLQLSRELARLVRARQPLESALAELARESAGSRARAAEVVSQRLAAGQSLAQSLAPGSSRWARMLAATVDVGHWAGRLDAALESWTSLHASLSSMRQRLFVASVYPILLMIVAVVSLTLTAWQLIPHYEKAFTAFANKPPSWLGAIVWVNHHLWLCTSLFIVVLLAPLALWWLRRRGVDALGVYREESSRCYVQSHVARLAALMIDSGRPVADYLPTLERAAGSTRFSIGAGASVGLPKTLDRSSTQRILGRETTMTLASLEGGMVTPDQCRPLLEEIASHTTRQGDARAQQAARWLPMLVALVVGSAVAITYGVLIYGPWMLLFRQIVDPTQH